MAGARPARRFADEARWQRPEWLQMRVAVANLADLRRRVSIALRSPTFRALLGHPAELTVDRIEDALDQRGGDPNPARSSSGSDDPLEWFAITGDYWDKAQDLTLGYLTVDDEVLGAGTPVPMPVLRQVPPI